MLTRFCSGFPTLPVWAGPGQMSQVENLWIKKYAKISSYLISGFPDSLIEIKNEEEKKFELTIIDHKSQAKQRLIFDIFRWKL